MDVSLNFDEVCVIDMRAKPKDNLQMTVGDKLCPLRGPGPEVEAGLFKCSTDLTAILSHGSLQQQGLSLNSRFVLANDQLKRHDIEEFLIDGDL